MVGIIDYGMGNLLSVYHALEMVGADVKICKNPEDLDIQFENRELRIHGKVAPRHNDIQFVYGEYGIGDFYRNFAIGESVDAGKISAELNNGVLTLHLPKTEDVKPRRIEVRSN